MAEFGKPDVVEEELDVLIIGGGMSACGAGYEIVPWLEAAKAQGAGIKVKLVDKAGLDRSAVAAQGLSAINTLGGPNPELSKGFGGLSGAEAGGEVLFDAVLFHAAEGGIGDDDLHPVAGAVAGQRLGQGVVVADLGGDFDAVQQVPIP